MSFTSSFSSLRYLNTSGAVSPAVAMGNVTLAARWRLTNLALASELIETNDATFVSNFNSAIFMNGSQVAWAITNAAGTRVSINPASGFMVVNTWTWLGITWDGTTIRAYVNGAQVASVAGPAGPFPNWSDLQIGPAEGEIQDAVFYNAALTAPEMMQLYLNRAPGRRLNLQIHVPIFPGSTNFGRDYSGFGRNFTNVNTPTAGTTVPQAGWGPAYRQLMYTETSGTPKPAAAGGDTLFDGNAGAVKIVPAAAGGDMLFGGSAAAAKLSGVAGGGDTLFGGIVGAQKLAPAAAGGDTLFGGSASGPIITKFVSAGGDTLFGGTVQASGTGPPPGSSNHVRSFRFRRGR